MVVGVSSLMWSAEFAADDEEEIERKKNMTAEDTAKEEKMWGLMMTGTVLRLAGSSDNKLVCTLSKPGLMLQGFVTREPDAEMVEVAIAAVEAVFDWKAWQGK